MIPRYLDVRSGESGQEVRALMSRFEVTFESLLMILSRKTLFVFPPSMPSRYAHIGGSLKCLLN